MEQHFQELAGPGTLTHLEAICQAACRVEALKPSLLQAAISALAFGEPTAKSCKRG